MLCVLILGISIICYNACFYANTGWLTIIHYSDIYTRITLAPTSLRTSLESRHCPLHHYRHLSQPVSTSMDYKRFQIGKVQSLANVSGCCAISNQRYFKQSSQSHIATKHTTVALASLTFTTLSSLAEMSSYISPMTLNIFDSFLLTFHQLLCIFLILCVASKMYPLWLATLNKPWCMGTALGINIFCFPYRTCSFPAPFCRA